MDLTTGATSRRRRSRASHCPSGLLFETKRIHYCYLLTRALPEGGCRYYVGIRTCPVGKTPATDSVYMGSGHAIRCAVRKHGRAVFTKTIVETFETRAEARAMERALVGLATANSRYSYNLVTGGEDSGLASEETKARVRAAKLAQCADPELKARVSNGIRRRFKDPAERAKIGEGNKRRRSNSTPEQRAARVESAANAARAAMQTEEWREAHGTACRRPDVREKNSAAVAAYWARMTPEERSAEGIRRLAAQERRRRDSAAE